MTDSTLTYIFAHIQQQHCSLISAQEPQNFCARTLIVCMTSCVSFCARRATQLGIGKMATSTTSVQDCEDYIEQHGIQAILKECIAKICQERPAQPYKWLTAYFDRLDKVRRSRGAPCGRLCLFHVLYASGWLTTGSCVLAMNCF